MTWRTRPDFVLAEQSGLWDAERWAWLAAARQATRASDVAIFTETTAAVPAGPRGWHAYHGENRPGADECSILWNGQIWHGDPRRGFAVPLSRTPFALGNGKPRPRIHAIGVPLWHLATGERVIFVGVHTPSAVEGRNGLVEGVRRALTYRETLAGLTALRRQLRRQYPEAAFVVAADWNLDLRRPWVRALLAAALPGLRSSWRTMPRLGTHGRRVIDGTRHTRGLTTHGSTLLNPVNGFDHTGVRTAFRFRQGRA